MQFESDIEKQTRFLALYRPLKQRLERFALVLTNNREEAKDVVSETLLRAFESFEKLHDEQGFLSFLFSTATRLYRRKHARETRVELIDNEQIDELIQSHDSTDSLHDLGLLRKCILSLEEAFREALVLSELIGLSDKEIAAIQGCSVANVRVRVYRAKRKLKKLMSDRQPLLEPNSVSTTLPLS